MASSWMMTPKLSLLWVQNCDMAILWQRTRGPNQNSSPLLHWEGQHWSLPPTLPHGVWQRNQIKKDEHKNLSLMDTHTQGVSVVCLFVLLCVFVCMCLIHGQNIQNKGSNSVIDTAYQNLDHTIMFLTACVLPPCVVLHAAVRSVNQALVLELWEKLSLAHEHGRKPWKLQSLQWHLQQQYL